MSILSALWSKAVWLGDAYIGSVRFALAKQQTIQQLNRAIPNLEIETTNLCNANCTFCAYQFQTRPVGTMEMDLFTRIIDEYDDLGGGDLNLTPTVGDILLDRHILARIAYARSKPSIKNIYSFSNFISLEKAGAKAMVASGITSLSVSISGLDEEQYKRVYRSSQYKKVIANIHAFIDANQEAGSPVDFRIEMRPDRPIQETLNSPDYRRIADRIGADHIGMKFRYDDWAGLITPEMLSGTMKVRTRLPAMVSSCFYMNFGPAIFWDGRVGACACRDVNADKLIIGDITKQHLGEIWFNNPILDKMRADFLTENRPAICQKCTQYNNLSFWKRPSAKRLLPELKPAKWPLSKSSSTNL